MHHLPLRGGTVQTETLVQLKPKWWYSSKRNSGTVGTEIFTWMTTIDQSALMIEAHMLLSAFL
jgi:hypothetical protein